MQENREVVIIPESKKKINKIKQKYKNLAMSDETAEKIGRLEILNNVLKTATIGAGLITVIDFFIPDPVPLADEALLTGITVALKSGNSIVENKINSLATTGQASLNMADCEEIKNRLVDIGNELSKKKSNGMSM